jgi:hypothetical protein
LGGRAERLKARQETDDFAAARFKSTNQRPLHNLSAVFLKINALRLKHNDGDFCPAFLVISWRVTSSPRFRSPKRPAKCGPRAIDGRACPAVQIAPGNRGPVRSHFRSNTTSNTSIARSPSSESLHSSSSEPGQEPRTRQEDARRQAPARQSESNTKPESAHRKSAYYG